MTIVILIGISACESGGKLRIVNKTSYPLFIGLEGEMPVTLPGKASNTEFFEHTFELPTDKQTPLSGTVKAKRRLILRGETYQIYDDVNEVFTDTTEIVVEAGQTLSAYISPNRASVKIVNDSSNKVLDAIVYRHNFSSYIAVARMTDIEAGTSSFVRLDYATTTNQFYYFVVITLDNGNEYTFGSETNILSLDNQLLIHLEDSM